MVSTSVMDIFLFALIFVIPVLVFQLETAILVSVIFGLSILCILSFNIAKEQGTKPWKVVTEHLIVAIVVIVITHYLGEWVSLTFI